jgi:predicted peroxiredoxin
MKKFLTYPLILIALFSCTKMVEKEESVMVTENAKDGVFLHVSSNDPHRVLMAMSMALMMAETNDVLLYFDIKGIEVLLNDAPDFEYAHFPSSRTQIAKLLDAGVGIMACPGCLQAAGKTKEDLMPGIDIAEKERFFNFTKGRIVSIDY